MLKNSQDFPASERHQLLTQLMFKIPLLGGIDGSFQADEDFVAAVQGADC
jgi:hypothetical protein